VEKVAVLNNRIVTKEEAPRPQEEERSWYNRMVDLIPWWTSQMNDEEESFNCAFDFVAQEFVNKLDYYAEVWYPAKEKVFEAVRNRNEIDPCGQIIEFPMGGCAAWKEHIFIAETELNIEAPILFAICQIAEEQSWSVVGVPEQDAEPFTTRTPLLPHLIGLSGELLITQSGIPDIIFVHTNGYMGGSKTRDGAIEMARKSIIAEKKLLDQIQKNHPVNQSNGNDQVAQLNGTENNQVAESNGNDQVAQSNGNDQVNQSNGNDQVNQSNGSENNQSNESNENEQIGQLNGTENNQVVELNGTENDQVAQLNGVENDQVNESNGAENDQVNESNGAENDQVNQSNGNDQVIQSNKNDQVAQFLTD